MTQRNDGVPDAADKNIEPNFRDMCAMFAMQAILPIHNSARISFRITAEDAYRMADSMLAARERS